MPGPGLARVPGWRPRSSPPVTVWPAKIVSAKVLGHERGPKLRVFKFKPKRGYKRMNGHRQELTRLQITGISASKGS